MLIDSKFIQTKESKKSSFKLVIKECLKDSTKIKFSTDFNAKNKS